MIYMNHIAHYVLIKNLQNTMRIVTSTIYGHINCFSFFYEIIMTILYSV